MNEQDIVILNTYFERKLASTPTAFRRSLYDVIDWDEPLIGVIGAKGVGKSTLLMQRIIEAHSGNISRAFYVSLDHFWFDNHSLADLIEHLYVHGVTHLYVDEVHHCKNWAKIFKAAIDSCHGLNIVYTGSSALKIDHAKADLSRRQTVHKMNVLSFREFLCLETGMKIPSYDLEHLLGHHVEIARNLTSGHKIIPLFEKYISQGAYPFYLISGQSYHNKLLSAALSVFETDLIEIENWEWETVQKARMLLSVIAPNVPFIPNITKLAEQLKCTRETCLKILYALEKAGLIQMLHSPQSTYKQLSRPDKIYLGDTNLMNAFNGRVNIGNARETFFMNQLSSCHSVDMPKQGDFRIDGKYLFEVGGADKTFEQIADLPDSYLAVDDTEIGQGHRLPLWMVGLMY